MAALFVVSAFGFNAKAQTDVTGTYLKNAGFSSIDGWNKVAGNTTSANTADKVTEWYRNKDNNSDTYIGITQSCSNLEEGVYRFTIHGFSRTTKDYTNIAFYAETNNYTYSTPLKTLASGTAGYGSTPNTTKSAYNAFTSSEHWMHTLDNIIIDKTSNAEGVLRVGLKMTGQIAGNGSNQWICIGNAKLYKLEGEALSSLINELINEAKALYLKNTNAAGADALNIAISTAENVEKTSLSYNDIKSLKNAIKTFKKARMSDATSETPIDATIYINNPSFEDGAKILTKQEVGMSGTAIALAAGGCYEAPYGWTTTIQKAGVSWDCSNIADASVLSMATSEKTSASDGNRFYSGRRRWASGVNKISQTVSGLPVGAYKLSVDLGKANGNNTGTFTLKLGESVIFTATPTTKGFATYTSDNFITNTVEDELTIEFANATSNDARFIIDNIKLTYYGDPLAAAKTELTNEINEAKGITGNMSTEASTGLSKAISDAETTLNTPTATLYDYNASLEALRAAIQKCEDSKTVYANIAALIESTAAKVASLDANGQAAYDITTITTAYENGTITDGIAETTAINEAYIAAVKAQGAGSDMTSLIVNPQFENSTWNEGWTGTGSNKAEAFAKQSGNAQFSGNFAEMWAGGDADMKAGDIYQTLTGLPAGVYQLMAKVVVNKDSKLYMKNGENTSEWDMNLVSSSDHRMVAITVTEGSDVTIGFSTVASKGCWIAVDDFTLTYVGADYNYTLETRLMNADVKKAQEDAKEAFIDEKNDANFSALLNAIYRAKQSADAYANVKANVDAAKTYVDNGTDGMTIEGDASYTTSYDKYYDGEYADTELGNVVLDIYKDAAAYVKKQKTTNGADFSLVTYNMGQTGTAGWSTTGNNGKFQLNTWSTEADETGMTTPFLENWVGKENDLGNATITNVIESMPAGLYTVTLLTRIYRESGAAELNGATAFANSVEENICDGTAFKYNGMNGVYETITLNTAVGVDGKLNIGFKIEDANFNWLAFKDIKIVYTGCLDYSALENAIAGIQEKLGFEAGDYAPYKNIESMIVFDKAEDICNNQTALTQGEIDELIAMIKVLEWTENEEEVNAVANEHFTLPESTAAADFYLTGWVRTNAWGQWRDDVATVNKTGYYNQPGSLEYGKSTLSGYTMPLKGNTAYKLTFKYGAWDRNTNVTATILNESGEGLQAVSTANTNVNYKDRMQTYSVTFITGVAGNYVLKLASSANVVITDVELYSVDALELNDKAVTNYQPGTYSNVSIARTFKTGYSTLALPFSTTATALRGTVYAFTGEDVDDAGNRILTVEEVDNVEANVPYFFYATEATESIMFENVEVVAMESKKVEKDDWTFISNFTPNFTGIVDNYGVQGDKVRPAGEGAFLNGMRAYLTYNGTEENEAGVRINFGGEATGIEAIDALTSGTVEAIYTINGTRVNSLQKGLNIVKMSNGKTQKVLVK